MTQYRFGGWTYNVAAMPTDGYAQGEWKATTAAACQSFKALAQSKVDTGLIDAKPNFVPAGGWVDKTNVACGSDYMVQVCAHPVPISQRDQCQRWSAPDEAAEVYSYSAQQRMAYPLITTIPADAPPASCPVGNPIYPLQGRKREDVETGWVIGRLPLRFTFSSELLPSRSGSTEDTWNGRAAYVLMPAWRPQPLGPAWHMSFQRRLTIQGARRGALLSRGDGHTIAFKGDGAGNYTPAAYGTSRLVTTATGHIQHDAESNAQEVYDSQGQLVLIQWASGMSAAFTYSDAATPSTVAPRPGHLIAASDDRSRVVQFEYDDQGLLVKMIGPAGEVITLTTGASGSLAGIHWPDTTSRSFLYDSPHPGLQRSLTGIQDELGVRYATFGYRASGHAESTEHAGGVGRFSVQYATEPSFAAAGSYDAAAQVIYTQSNAVAPQGVELTDPNGAVRTLTATSIHGRLHLSGQSQPAGSGCDASTSAQSFDANGNVASRDDFNGSRTCQAHNTSRNLLTTRVEGLAASTACTVTAANSVLPAGSRKTSIQWHPDWRLETRIAQPGVVRTDVYNGQPDPFNGNVIAACAPGTALLPDGKPIVVLCRRVEQATTDPTGAAGFNAAMQPGVPAREWKWTYNALGQVLTEDGPRTDVSDVTTYEYYEDTTADHTKGDLRKITNPAGQATQFMKYNAHGQVLESLDVNGVMTVNTYDLRQRLRSTTTAGEVTSYTYDLVGQLKKVTLPDGSWLGYDYDDAHRLVAVYDHKGNRTEYVLDNAGNRTAQNTRDSSGNLKRQVSRTMDALGRVQQTTGRD